MSKQYAVLWCANYKDGVPLKKQMIDALGVQDDVWHILDPMDADFDKQAYGYDGYVISGSARSVSDDKTSPLVARIMHFLGEIDRQSSAPVVGICFGAQALAHAYGGQVGANRSGRIRLGVESLSWTEHATRVVPQQDRSEVAIAQSHYESVLQLPADAQSLACSPTTENEIFLIRRRYLGIQGHPEVDNETLSSVFLAFHRDDLDKESLQTTVAEVTRPLQVTPVIQLIRRLLEEGTL